MKVFLSVILLLTFSVVVWGVTPEEIEAAFTPEKVEEFKEAAERGEAWAQYNLGNLYAAGKGVPEDKKESVKWYKKAAEQGLATAPVSAGLLFKARGLLHLPASLDPERLRDELEAVASDLMVDLHMHKEL